MSVERLVHLTSIAELREAAPAWDDLWSRSDVAMPTARAELLAQWLEQFCPTAAFHALAVEFEGRWIAAIPLIGIRVGKVLPAGGLPSNPWSSCGELLIDPAADGDSATSLLLNAAGDLPWQLLWLNEAISETSRWRTLLRACDRAGLLFTHHERYRVGRVEIGRDWSEYQRQLRKGHRHNMNRVSRRLSDEGDVQLDVRSHLEVEEVGAWMRTMFEVEDKSWKGEAGTSVLGSPGMFPFFVRQAEQLARWGQLEIASLRLNGRMVAFVYGCRAKGVLYANKIGYDPQFATFSPGQLLFYRLIEQLHNEGEIHALDFFGPLTESLSRWQPTTYGIDRVAIALRRPLGLAALYAYKTWWPRIRELKNQLVPAPGIPSVESPATQPVGA